MWALLLQECAWICWPICEGLVHYPPCLVPLTHPALGEMVAPGPRRWCVDIQQLSFLDSSCWPICQVDLVAGPLASLLTAHSPAPGEDYGFFEVQLVFSISLQNSGHLSHPL